MDTFDAFSLGWLVAGPRIGRIFRWHSPAPDPAVASLAQRGGGRTMDRFACAGLGRRPFPLGVVHRCYSRFVGVVANPHAIRVAWSRKVVVGRCADRVRSLARGRRRAVPLGVGYPSHTHGCRESAALGRGVAGGIRRRGAGCCLLVATASRRRDAPQRARGLHGAVRCRSHHHGLVDAPVSRGKRRPSDVQARRGRTGGVDGVGEDRCDALVERCFRAALGSQAGRRASRLGALPPRSMVGKRNAGAGGLSRLVQGVKPTQPAAWKGWRIGASRAKVDALSAQRRSLSSASSMDGGSDAPL